MLNKFCYLEEQFMLVWRVGEGGEWKSQGEKLGEEELELAWSVCRAFEERGRGLLMFYKCAFLFRAHSLRPCRR